MPFFVADISHIQNTPSLYNNATNLFSPPGPPIINSMTSVWNATLVSCNGDVNITEQLYETKVRPEEERFHVLFSNILVRNKDGSKTGILVENMNTQAMYARNYALVLSDVIADTEVESRREMANTSRKSSLDRTHNEARAERDFWNLLFTLTEANLVIDIEEDFESSKASVLNSCGPDASLVELLNLAYQYSPRVKKGRVLKDWIEVSLSLLKQLAL